MRNTFHTPTTLQANRVTQEQHREEIKAVLAEVNGILGFKGQDYDNLNTFVERMIFGDYSWATLVYIKADRLCSTLMMDHPEVDAKTDDCLIDLIVYSIAYRAWRNIQARKYAAIPEPKTAVPFQYDDTKSPGEQAAKSLINSSGVRAGIFNPGNTTPQVRKED